MSVTHTRSGAKIGRTREPEEMSVNSYDRVSSLLVSVLILFGFIVGLMFLVWLSTRWKYTPPVVPVVMADELGGGGSGSGAPGEQQLEEVNPEEVKDLQEPPIDQSVQLITDVVSTQAVDLEALQGASSGAGNGQGNGTGDGRGPGPGGPGTATQLPDWEVRFNATTIELYAQQLDFFGIELGAIGGGKKTVDYASKLSDAKPVARSGTGDQEKRRYLVWRKGPLAAADKTLLAKAGVETSGRVVLQFLPDPTERQMAQLEAEHAKGRKLNQIRRTVFGVKGTAGAFEFFVLEQDYR